MTRQDLINLKCTRIMLYYDELSRHKVDISAALEFMEYIFNVQGSWVMRIVKGAVNYESVILSNTDIDLMVIDAYVKKLHRKAVSERQYKIKFEN